MMKPYDEIDAIYIGGYDVYRYILDENDIVKERVDNFESNLPNHLHAVLCCAAAGSNAKVC